MDGERLPFILETQLVGPPYDAMIKVAKDSENAHQKMAQMQLFQAASAKIERLAHLALELESMASRLRSYVEPKKAQDIRGPTLIAIERRINEMLDIHDRYATTHANGRFIPCLLRQFRQNSRSQE